MSTKLDKMVVQNLLKIIGAEMLSQLVGRFDSKTTVPRNIRDRASLNRQSDYLPLIH